MGRYSSLVGERQGEPTAPQPTSSVVAGPSTLGNHLSEETAPWKRRRDEDDVSATGKKLVVNRVENVSSSIAGANSSEFDKYRRTRRREQERLDAIERERKEAEERNSLFAKVQRNKLEAEERTRRNAERRQRKKLKKARKTQATELKHDVDNISADGPTSEHENDSEAMES